MGIFASNRQVTGVSHEPTISHFYGWSAIVIAVASLVPVPVTARPVAAAAAETWHLATHGGRPAGLQGVWDFGTLTPLERRVRWERRNSLPTRAANFEREESRRQNRGI